MYISLTAVAPATDCSAVTPVVAVAVTAREFVGPGASSQSGNPSGGEDPAPAPPGPSGRAARSSML